MKKLVLIIGLIAFLGGAFIAQSSNTSKNTTTVQIDNEKCAVCGKEACDGSCKAETTKKACCKKDADASKKCCEKTDAEKAKCCKKSEGKKACCKKEEVKKSSCGHDHSAPAVEEKK